MNDDVISQLRSSFNSAAGSVRVIAFLSPTCGPCRYGQGVVRAMFEEFPLMQLTGLIIWVPMLPGDSVETADVEQRAITDPRFRFWYDGDKAAANAWSSFIGYPKTTWDVYAVYDGAAGWEDGAAPPPPRIWMHQLDPTPATQISDRLDPFRLAGEWLGLLGRSIDQQADLAVRFHASGNEVSVRSSDTG